MSDDHSFFGRPTVPVPADIEVEARQVADTEEEPVFDLPRYWSTVRRHLRVVFGVASAAVIITMVRLIGEPPIYQAETTVLIQPNAEGGTDTLQNLVEIEAAAANSDQYYKTQCAILESRDLAAEVVSQLRLDHNPAFTGRSSASSDGFARLWPWTKPSYTSDEYQHLQLPPEGSEAPLAEAPASVVHTYLAMLKVSPVPDTDLVKISFTATDPTLSAELANAHVAAYQRRQNQMRGLQSEEAQRFMHSKLADIKDQLQKSEVALNDYRRQKGIIPGLISLDGKDAVVLDRLADLSKDLTQAQVARISLESQVQLIDKHQYTSLPEVNSNVTIQDLQKQLNDLYGQSAALASQFRADYPPLAKLDAEIGEVQARLKLATDDVVGAIRVQYQEAVAKENELQAEMARQRTETLNLNDSAAQYAILQREVDTNRELYNAVLTRMKDAAVASGAERISVTVINSAEAPSIPISPHKGRDLMLALVVGLAGGIGAAFVLELLDNTLRNPEEAESYLHLPNLGVVPDFARSAGPGSVYGSRPLVIARDPANGLPATELHGSYSALGEAYRNLRTALLLSRAGSPPQTILITSATSREGKTVTSVNIAAMLAQLGSSILIDADLRRARCHQVLGIENAGGLTEVLTGASEYAAVIRKTAVENLDFLGSGSAPPNPTELVGSVKMAETLAELSERYRYIVIDSSPVLPVSDGLLLARLVDGIVVVANCAATPRQQVRAACLRLQYARGKILGVVLNRIHPRSHDYQHYYHDSYYTERPSN